MSRMPSVLWLVVLLNVIAINGQDLPFEVNEIKTCDTKISLDRRSLTGVRRGDENAPCSGYLMYSDGGVTKRMCGKLDYGLSIFSAERACFTLGANLNRVKDVFDPSATRQIMLYRCFSYKEQGVDSPETDGPMEVFDTDYLLDNWGETICRDYDDNPAAYDCFDTCYFNNEAPSLGTEDACADGQPFFAIGCADFNECETGVRDNCTGPYESSCTIRTACGKNTDCTNHPGSFQCSCKKGYESRNGKDFDPYDLDEGCKDVDECTESPCDVNAKCANTLGSYLCWCRDGFIGDGKRCSPITCFVQGYCQNGECQLINGRERCVCDEGYTGLRCETWTISTALILSIVGLVLFVLVIILLLLVIICMKCSPPPKTHCVSPQQNRMVVTTPFPTKTYGMVYPA